MSEIIVLRSAGPSSGVMPAGVAGPISGVMVPAVAGPISGLALPWSAGPMSGTAAPRSSARSRTNLGREISGASTSGLQHAWRPPQAGEPLHAEHLLRSVTQAIDLATGDPEPACWHFRLDGADYLVESDGHRWSLTTGAPSARADVTITATTQALTALIFAGSDTGLDITGETRPVQRFRQLISTMATVVHPA
jgi:hypothetical protein